MSLAFEHAAAIRETGPGRFTRVSIQGAAGEIEARLSDSGYWELRVRRDQETRWQLACTGDVDCGVVSTQPTARSHEETICRGRLTIDPAGRRAAVEGTEVKLTRKEFGVLLVLAAQPNRVFSREELFRAVWGQNYSTTTRTLDTHMSRVRVKLEKAGAPNFIVNVHDVGYKLWERPDLDALPALGPTGRAAPASLRSV